MNGFWFKTKNYFLSDFNDIVEGDGDEDEDEELGADRDKLWMGSQSIRWVTEIKL